ncbi:MAG: chemotaxis protein CheW [Ruminococcus sp.]|nr:chemotaxis protein CheW [Ruminococcus sp.]
MSRYLTFKTAGSSFAAEFADVLRIVASADAEISPAPGFPPYMPGTAAIDGEAMPVIDTAKRFGIGERVTGERSCCILSRLDPSSGMSGRYEICAVLVDEVTGIIETEELSPPPALNSDSYSRYMKGTFIDSGVTYYVISPELLASS